VIILFNTPPQIPVCSPHYLVKFECAKFVQLLHKNVFHFRAVKSRYLQEISIADEMLSYRLRVYAEQFTILQCSPCISKHPCFEL